MVDREHELNIAGAKSIAFLAISDPGRVYIALCLKFLGGPLSELQSVGPSIALYLAQAQRLRNHGKHSSGQTTGLDAARELGRGASAVADG